MIAHRLAAIVDASRRYAGSLMIVFVLLSLAGGYFTATHISMDTDLDTLISRDLPWRQREAALDRAFPQNDNIVAVVIDAKTPDPAADAAAALAARLSAMPQLFHDVRVPEGGTFFRQEGLLFFPTQDVQNFSDQIIAAQPLIGTLAADPTLRGVFSALDLLAQGVAQGAIDAKGVIAPLSAVSDAIQSTLTGRYAPLSWQTLLSGRTPDPQELRRFVLAQPVLDYGALLPGARAVDTIHDIARSLGLTPERGVDRKSVV